MELLAKFPQKVLKTWQKFGPMQALNGHFKEPQSHSSSLLKLQRLNTTAMLSPRFLELRKIHISDSCKAFFRNSIQWLKPQERLGISHSSSLLKLQGLVPPKTTAVLWTVPLSPSLLELHMSEWQLRNCIFQNYKYWVIKRLGLFLEKLGQWWHTTQAEAG